MKIYNFDFSKSGDYVLPIMAPTTFKLAVDQDLSIRIEGDVVNSSETYRTKKLYTITMHNPHDILISNGSVVHVIIDKNVVAERDETVSIGTFDASTYVKLEDLDSAVEEKIDHPKAGYVYFVSSGSQVQRQIEFEGAETTKYFSNFLCMKIPVGTTQIKLDQTADYVWVDQDTGETEGQCDADEIDDVQDYVDDRALFITAAEKSAAKPVLTIMQDFKTDSTNHRFTITSGTSIDVDGNEVENIYNIDTNPGNAAGGVFFWTTDDWDKVQTTAYTFRYSYRTDTAAFSNMTLMTGEQYAASDYPNGMSIYTAV